MRGEITDYKDSLRRRVALLRGVPLSALQAVYDQRLHLNPGAETLIAACKQAGLRVVLLSGGFNFFTDRLRERLQLDDTRSNVLEIEDGRLTGRMLPSPGATSATARPRRTSCSNAAARWAYRRPGPSPWATARTTCR